MMHMPLPRDDAIEAIEQIVRLRRAERHAGGDDVRDDSRARSRVRSSGLSVRPSGLQTPRLLGLRPPSVHRWIEEQEIPTVMTASGRREIPLLESSRS